MNTSDWRTGRKNSPTLISLFSGTGGLDLGLEQAGFRTLLANEVEPYACESLRANRFLRSLDETQFEAWFNEHIVTQRCYKMISPIEKQKLHTRISSALIEKENYLDHADIVERDVRYLFQLSVTDIFSLSLVPCMNEPSDPVAQPVERASKGE